jgi:hypothetical protein
MVTETGIGDGRPRIRRKTVQLVHYTEKRKAAQHRPFRDPRERHRLARHASAHRFTVFPSFPEFVT